MTKSPANSPIPMPSTPRHIQTPPTTDITAVPASSKPIQDTLGAAHCVSHITCPSLDPSELIPESNKSLDADLEDYLHTLATAEESQTDAAWWTHRGENLSTLWEYSALSGLPLKEDLVPTQEPETIPSESASSVGSSRRGHGAPQIAKEEVQSEALTAVEKRKREIRRERNRASAQRCNRRKKAIRDELKLQLRDSENRIELLRAKEMDLRKENMRLRKTLVVKRS